MARYAAARRSAHRAVVPFAVIGLTITGFSITTGGAAVADDYPGEDQIAAARDAADGAAASVASLDAAIASLESALQDAEVASMTAAEDYQVALDTADTAKSELAEAEKRADDADAALALARRGLAGSAMQSYKNAGSMGSLEAITQADGFDDVISRTEAVNQASAKADVTVQEVSAAELVATTTRDYADKAAVKAADAEKAAAEALDTANAARASADQAVSDAEVARGAAVTKLAELRGVTEDLEQERQDGLAAERAAREQAAFEAEQERLAAQDYVIEVDHEVGGDTDSSTGGSNSTTTSTPKPTSTSTSSPKPTSSSKPTSTPKPTTTSTPRPTETSDPEPSETSTPKPTETSQPKPTETAEPEPETPSQSWSSTAAQGRSAAAWAVTKTGASYLLGGTGPAYDCSGLTMMAWSQAGEYITRSSRTQYNNVAHVSYSQIRAGDLVFYSSNGSAGSIYHVAMYIGNGQVMEATTPGHTAKVRSLYGWGTAHLMPYVGRP
ncbi:NlpC/P60 family protein [Demequina sp. NBRC 110057]|uniref:C40 family peptidase n=1 Tax=Demequina sp. NBRC 110057 TaxID=1570346 RepID=UPI000A06412E|nr:C40 family peptidase [Demequina sp. NBRC 110057]